MLSEKPQTVCVAVRKKGDDEFRVVHIETRRGKLEKALVSTVAKDLTQNVFMLLDTILWKKISNGKC